jgi:hypothetical protein
LIFVILEISTSKFIPRTVNVVFPQERYQFSQKISGLKINVSKTQVIWIGSKKYSSDRLCENWNLSWGKTTFTVLGINFDVDISKITGFGSAIKRWLSTGRISDLTTVILPIGVKFLLFHCLKSPFIFFKYFS